MENNNTIINSVSIDNILAELSVPYNDTEVLTTSSKELVLVDQFFDNITCSNKEIETLLYEVIGYSLCKTAKLRKAFIFKGKGANGKSKILRICENLLGTKQCSNENTFETKQFSQCSHEHLENLSGSKAGSKSTVGSLKGCTVNIAEDQKQPKYINTSIITRLISGEPISYELKNKEQDVLVPYATLLFSVNEVIDFKETGIFITDRFVVIPFNATFTDDNNNRDINIGDKLCEPKALQIIATRAIQAFSKVLENGKFTIPTIVEEATKEYFMECNNVVEFCNSVPIKEFIVKAKYYEEYRNWCKLNNREAVSNSKFGKEVLALGYRTERYQFGTKRDTYYASPDFNSDSRDVYNEYLRENGITEETAKKYSDKEMKEIFNAISFSEYLCKNLYKVDEVKDN